MYWTSEADLSGFIFGNAAEWLFGEQVRGMYEWCTKSPKISFLPKTNGYFKGFTSSKLGRN